MSSSYPADRKRVVADELSKFTDNDKHRASVALVETQFAVISPMPTKRRIVKRGKK